MFSHPNHPQPPVRAGRSAQWISVRIPRGSPRDQDSQTCRSRGAGRCPLLLPGSLTPARPASRRQRPGQSITGPDPEAAPENPCALRIPVSSSPAGCSRGRASPGRPAGRRGLAWPLKSQDPPATPGAPHAQEQAERRHQSSSLHATLHVISDARGRDCDHTPNSTKPGEEERPGGGAGQARGGPPRHSPQAAPARAPCSSLRTRRRQRLPSSSPTDGGEEAVSGVWGSVRFRRCSCSAGVRGAPSSCSAECRTAHAPQAAGWLCM